MSRVERKVQDEQYYKDGVYMKTLLFSLFVLMFTSCKQQIDLHYDINIYAKSEQERLYNEGELLTLQNKEQSGDEVTLANGIAIGDSSSYEAIFEFQLPYGFDEKLLDSIALLYNFWSDQAGAEQLFEFYLLDQKDHWTNVNDTQAKYSAEWTYFRQYVINAKEYLHQRSFLLKVKSNSGEAFLDYLSLNLNPGSTTTLPIEREDGKSGDWFRPWPGMRWGVQYTGDFAEILDVEVYNIDLFETSKEAIENLKDRGINVVCYFSGGSSEDWRPDFDQFPASVKGKSLDGWPGEKWLDVRQTDILMEIMTARMDLAVDKGCDGIDVDNVDGFTNDSGFKLSYDDQLAYNRMTAKEAHKRGLGIGLKNDLVQVEDLVADYDWAVNEQCFKYNECHNLFPFVENGKPVWGIEYKVKVNEFCEDSLDWGFDTIQKKLKLDEWVKTCY